MILKLNLYNIGDTLYKFYDNYKYCEICGKLIENSKNKKFCNECAKIRKYKPKELHEQIKKVICVDCKKEFETSSKNNKEEYRCDKCHKLHERELTRLRVEKYRKKQM